MEIVARLLDRFENNLETYIGMLRLDAAQLEAARMLRHDLANVRTLAQPRSLELRARYDPDLVKAVLLDMDVELLATVLVEGGPELIGRMSRALDRAHRAPGGK